MGLFKNPVMVPRSTIHKQKRKFFTLFPYHYIFLCFFWHFTRWCQDAQGAVLWDTMTAWGGVAVPPLTAKGSGSLSCRACSSESQEKSRGQSQERGWETEGCREEEEEEEDNRVPPATLRQGARGRGHPIGGGWRIPGYGVQMQGGHRWRREEATALQEG